ncbi:MAG: bacterial transcriptional activator domain-containing protein [Pseudomonadota bacterium]
MGALALVGALAAGLAGMLAATGTARAQVDPASVDWAAVVNEVPDFPGVALFDMPRLQAQMDVVAGYAAEGSNGAALRILDRLIRRYPLVNDLHATRALLLARMGRIESALTALDQALDLGYRGIGAIRRAPAFARLSANPRFRRIAALDRDLPELPPLRTRASRIDGQNALVDAGNTRWDPAKDMLVSGFVFPEVETLGPPLGTGSRGPRGQLAKRIAAGQAAGLSGVLYDNRDGDHSPLRRDRYPRLSFVEYAAPAREAGLHYGPARWNQFDAITFGNSSTAITGGPAWRSQARVMLTDPAGPRQLAQLFVANHVYVYPEHRDHDPNLGGADGWGDLFPANTPYFVVSQGSSGSDQPFLNAIAHILAAFTPATRQSLEARRLIAPTVMMALRRGMAAASDDDERYMSGAAHAPVLEREGIRLGRMIDIAARLTPVTTPPMPVLGVVQDLDAAPDVELLGDGLDETLFDTPFAAARLWRSTVHTRRVILEARAAGGLGEAPLTFRWRLLQGIEDRVRIRPLNAQGTRALVEIDWHGRYPVPWRDDMTTDRVDVGVFIDNGDEISLPATFSILAPSIQERVYEAGTGGTVRLAEIAYAPDDDAGLYADPLLFPVRAWRDVMFYRRDGSLEGWERIYGDTLRRRERYTAQGLLVHETDGQGRPRIVEPVDYPVNRRINGRLAVDVKPTGGRLEVIYASAESISGSMVPADRAGLADEAEVEARRLRLEERASEAAGDGG